MGVIIRAWRNKSMDKLTIRDVDVAGKTVLVRVDFNVPMKDNGTVITDDNRIVAALPTINYLLEHNPKAVVLFSHLGKIKTEEDKAKNNMAVVAPRLAELLGRDVKFVNATRGPELEDAIKNAENGQVILVQNKEIAYIGKAVSDPERPLVAILGGSKVSSKIGVIENLLKVADKVIIGDGMMFTFWKAKGLEVGNSLVEVDKVELAKEYLEKGADKLVLPVDAVVNNAFAAEGDIKTVEGNVPEGYMGLDIGPKSIELIKENLAGAKTVIWNGPMGVFEMEPFAKGTLAVCEMLANMPDANTIIGGGDSAAAVKQLGFADKVSHISTGGGASLEYMEGKVLPGIAAVDDK